MLINNNLQIEGKDMTFDEFKEKYELNLNEQQTNAVKEIDGPTLLPGQIPGNFLT